MVVRCRSPLAVVRQAVALFLSLPEWAGNRPVK
jgi:hypothetical protein